MMGPNHHVSPYLVDIKRVQIPLVLSLTWSAGPKSKGTPLVWDVVVGASEGGAAPVVAGCVSSAAM